MLLKVPSITVTNVQTFRDCALHQWNVDICYNYGTFNNSQHFYLLFSHVPRSPRSFLASSIIFLGSAHPPPPLSLSLPYTTDISIQKPNCRGFLFIKKRNSGSLFVGYAARKSCEIVPQ